MDDRKNDSEQHDEPQEDSLPPGVGQDPGMAGRVPVYKKPEDQKEDEAEVPIARIDEDAQPTEIPPAQPTDIDPTAAPLPYRGQTVEPDQPYQSQGFPVQGEGMFEETPTGLPGENPLKPGGPPEPTTTGTSQPTGRKDRSVWLMLIIAAVVVCIALIALVVGGVFISPGL